MDEPTTHLDVGSIDALIDALKQYHGTLIFISHDVHFIRAIATSVLHVTASPARTAGANHTGGKLTFYPGDYDYYLDKSKATSARTALTADFSLSSNSHLPSSARTPASAPNRGAGQRARKRADAEARNAISKAKREKEKRVHELETKIATLEAHQTELAAALEDPAVYTTGGRATVTNRDLSAVAHNLTRLTPAWVNATVASCEVE